MESVRSIFSAFLTVLLWLLVLVLVDAQRRAEEVQALTAYRVDVGGGSDENSGPYGYWVTWNENDENACSWVGITCTADFTVSALDLSGWGLGILGSFAALAKLPDLRQLDLSSNFHESFTASDMEDDIGSLTQLTRLDLSDNGFLSISQNITKCRSLKYLSLQNNFLSGAIPDLSELVHLQILLLADNQLSSSFPRELGKLSSLVTIDVSNNNLSGLIPSLVNSTNLENLMLGNNTFVGFEEPFSINAPNLQQLVVSENALEGMIPLAIGDLLKLRVLDMSRNQLSGEIPSGLSTVTLDEFTIDLSQNRLNGSFPLDLLQPSFGARIVHINISHNLLSGTIPSLAATTKHGGGTNTTWIDLDLSHNQLMGPIPSQLNETSYIALNLENNHLSGDIVDVLIASQVFGGETEVVFLGNNHLTGDLSGLTFHWANWSFLYVIDLSNNNLSWRASESIPDPLSAALSRFPEELTEFRVRGNNFSGTSLPHSPISQDLLSLQILDFSDNQLQGVVSGAVFNPMSMPILRTLDLSNNFAIGPIPDNITRLPLLTTLDLSNNKLSGSLPFIPLNSSLINPSFFLGNDGLCGYPLPQCPGHGTGVQWWILLITIGGSVIMVVGSCLVVTWRWRVFRKRHEQDADLIRTLMERELVTLMPLHTLKKATDNFAESARIGEGGFGTVYIGKLNDGTSVAIKRSKREGSEKDKEQFLNEVRILSQVNHRHLVKLMGCCMENKVALLVFELVSNGTLQDHLQGKIGDCHLSWKQRLNIAVQTADALNYLHTATIFPIYHRDVKSANILLNDDLSTKVADFGISKLAPMNATHVSTALQGTMGYIDPEYWVSFQLTEKSDVYSFGVVLLELISAKPPVDFQRGGDETSLVIFASPHIEGGDLHPLIDPTLMGTYSDKSGHGKESILEVGRLAMKCLNMQSKLRPSMNEVWKELQDLCLDFRGTFMNEDLGFLNKNDNENPQVDHEVLLSQLSFGDSSSYVIEYGARSFEMAQFSSPPSFGPRSMGS